MQRTMLAILLLLAGPTGRAEIYAYVNEVGDYVVTREAPGDVAEYAVLSDDGEFLRMVHPREMDVPISHWRPWFIPKQPDPFDGETTPQEREGRVDIEEVRGGDDGGR